MANGEIINKPIFKRVTFSGAKYTDLAASGGAKNYTAANVGFEIPEGYEVFGIQNLTSGNMNVSISGFNPSVGTGRFICVRNQHSAAISATPYISVTFINKKYLEYGQRRNLSVTTAEGISVTCSEIGDILVGHSVTITVDDPQETYYVLHPTGLIVASVPMLNSSNDYSYTFTMPDNDVSISVDTTI